MKNSKRIIAFAFALIFIFSLASCGTFTPPVNTGTDTNTNTGGGGSEKEVEFSDEAFTVSLRYRGELYIPEAETIVYWTKVDGKGAYSSCPIYKNGVAGIEAGVDGVEKGLDGDYRVTLSYVPQGIAYNPNGYIATNDNRHLIIDLYDIQKTSGKGLDPYKCISISKTAVYEVTLNSPTHKVFYEFRPSKSGMYTVESWMDTTAEKYNPYCHTYTGTFAAKFEGPVVDGGGAEGVYTKNFLNGINVSDDMIGNVLTFAVSVDAKNQENYPVKVTFVVQLDGGFDGKSPYEDYDMYVMKEDPSTYLNACKTYDKSQYKLVGAERELLGREGAYVFDETMYALWKKEDGGDNLYHLYSKELYPETNGYGPILYAYISQPCRFIDRAFTYIEQESNPLSMKLQDGSKVNYKHFIEGYTSLATRNEPLFNGGSYYCDEFCPCHLGQDYGMACTVECEKCISDCRRIKAENIGFEGIQSYANIDGLVAVTEEVKEFLLNFSINQRYFADGEGWVETNDFIEIDSNDESQWLFACAYYKKIN